MTKIKTSELTGVALDWVVAVAKGMFAERSIYTSSRLIDGKLHLLNDAGDVFNDPFCPSTRWSQGGPIVERESMWVGATVNMAPAVEYLQSDDRKWFAQQMNHRAYGPTPLIAAMRCFVASKLGDEVDTPEELL